MPHSRKRDHNWLKWYLDNSDIILIILAVIDLFFLTLSILDKSFAVSNNLLIWSVFISFIFAFDFILKYFTAHSKKHYLQENWWQIPIILLPFLQTFRILILLRIFVLFYRARHNLKILLVEKGLIILFVFMVIVALMFGVVILMLEESNPLANIKDLEAGMWWSFVTMTSVGYGDKYPITMAGRIAAVILMFIGTALVAIFTAQFTAMIIESDKKDKKILDEIHKLHAELETTREEIKGLKQVIEEQHIKKEEP